MKAVGWIALWAALAQLPEEFAQDLRGVKPLPPTLRLFGPDAARVVKAEPEGLRIRLPAGRESLDAVGVEPRFTASGDFEITASYEVIRAERPSEGWGAGVNLRIELRAPGKAAASLARYLDPEEGDVYVAWRRFKDERAENPDRREVFPTKANFGKLRLARRGSVLSFLVADGRREDFRELCQEEVGSEDVRLIRLAANTGGSPTALDVRLWDLRVRSGGLPNEPGTVDAGGRRWLLVLLGACAAGAALAAGVYGARYWRRGRPGAETASKPPARGTTFR